MSFYAETDGAGRVLRVVETEQMPEGAVLLQGFTGWPAQPFPGAVLKVTDGELYWHDPRPLEEVKAARWSAIKAHREQLDAEPFVSEGFTIDADASSRMDLMGAILAMQLTNQASRLWRCADNVMRELSFADIVAVGTGIAARRQTLIEHSDALYQQLLAADTLAEVEAVVWGS